MVSLRYVSPSETYEEGPYHRLQCRTGYQIIFEIKLNSAALGEDDDS